LKSLTTFLLYALLALCLGLFGYSVWQGMFGQPLPPPVSLDSVPSSQPATTVEDHPHTTSADAELPAAVDTPPSVTESPRNLEATSNADKSIRIAIIIDDVGYNLDQGTQLAKLPGALTLAVLPHSPYGVKLAELGHQQGKEIMLHVPMSTVIPRQLDVGGLTEEMTEQEFEHTLVNNLASIPHVRGLNNHMGSELTRQHQPMQWLMRTLAREGLFFIDSRTSADSVALDTAEKYQVPTRKRDVFLDNLRDIDSIQQQFDTLIELAHEHGSAIAIGHPYPETLAFLQQLLPTLAQHGIKLVPASQLLTRPTSQNINSLSSPPPDDPA
jgi:polysaccharide deacetylase 2 family uncharacterized protein YibQ